MTCSCGKRSVTGERNPSTSGQALNAGIRQNVQQGIGLYRTFNRFDPSSIVMIRQSRVIPPVVVELGELVGLIYRSDKDQRGRPQAYIHFMEEPPRLVCNVEGRQLYIVGGSYRVTPQGIEG